MTAARSVWRECDAVAYDRMRAASYALVALLLDTSEPATAEARSVLREAQSVDGFDRSAVDAARAQFDARLSILQATHHD